jgi:hypothetical protein
MKNLVSLHPVLEEFPFDVVLEEAQIRENYLTKAYLPSIKEQSDNIGTAIDLLKYRKIGGIAKGRGGGAVRDFISRLKNTVGYDGRIHDGKVRPQAKFIEDLTVTRFPEDLSTIVFASGRGTTEDVVRRIIGCCNLQIPSVSFTYNLNSPVYKMATVHFFLPKKVERNHVNNPHIPVDLHTPLDVMGNSFETGLYISLSGIAEGLKEFHREENLENGSIKALQYIESSVDYVKYLNRYLFEIKNEIIELGAALSNVPHVRMAAAGEGMASLLMATNRIGHIGRIGIDNRSIDVITLEGAGPPGFLDIKKGDAVVLSSASLRTSHPIYVAQEATRADADIYLLTSDRAKERLPEWLEKYKIKDPKLVIHLPFSSENEDFRFYDIAVRHVLEYACTGSCIYLGLTTEDVEWFHIQRELE